MHRYQDADFTAIEFGIRLEHLHRMTVDGGGATPTPTRTRTVTGDGGRTKSIPVTPTDEVREATKDGKVTDVEKKTVFDRAETKDIVKSEEDRLRQAVKDAGGEPKVAPQPGTYNRGPLVKTDHDKRVDELTKEKEHGGLDALDKQIKQFEADGNTAAADSARSERNARAAEEAKVASVIEDRQSLAGTLDAEKAQLQQGVDPKAQDGTYADLRAEADKWITQFNDNGGQYYEGNDLFGDDWDESKVDFDRLANRFHDDPDLLKDFASSQGKDDGDLRGKSETEVYDYINSHYDAETREKVRNRYVAAQKLTGIMEQYNAARDSFDGNGDRIKEIDGEISRLNEANDHDRQALSSETIAKLDANDKPIDGILPEPTPSTDPSDRDSHKQAPTTPSTTDTPDTTPSKPTPSTPTNGAPEGEGGGPDPHPGTQTEPTTDVPRTRTVTVDYTTDAKRAEVLKAAQAKHLLPAANTTFDKDGQAVYTVQPGDSYWRISDQSDGQPDSFDFGHFQANLNSNSERLGRSPESGLIHPNEQLVLPNRSITDLVGLLGLPTTIEEELPSDSRAQQPR